MENNLIIVLYACIYSQISFLYNLHIVNIVEISMIIYRTDNCVKET